MVRVVIRKTKLVMVNDGEDGDEENDCMPVKTRRHIFEG